MYKLIAKNNSALGNFKDYDIPLLLTECLVESINANSMTGSAPSRGQATFTATGNFSFNGTPKTWADVKGTVFSLELSFGGVFSQTETWSDGLDLQRYGDFAYKTSLLSGNDYFEGSSTEAVTDAALGSGGNDTFKGHGSGKDGDYFFGGSGTDTSIYRGKASEYTVKRSNTLWDGRQSDSNTTSGIVVTDLVKDRDGADGLIEVERLQFSDRTVALDISGTAGQAYRVYQAAFNRTPDNGGLKYWIGLMDGGYTLAGVASGFIASDEFKKLYGSNPTNELFVSKLYDNVLHRAPDTGGYNYWVGLLNTNKIDNISTLINFSESPENQAGVIGVIQNGITLFN
jgi:hypothetical protein